MQLTENFSLHEFDCNDGTPVPEHLLGNVEALAEQLQILRDYLKEPVRINSAFRHANYNKKIGGAPDSMHLRAMAADITVKSKTPKQVKAVIERLIKAKKLKFGGIGLYPGFVHVDIRGAYARW
jgi:uncharacterized protein YcbK (DUF882 family)